MCLVNTMQISRPSTEMRKCWACSCLCTIVFYSGSIALVFFSKVILRRHTADTQCNPFEPIYVKQNPWILVPLEWNLLCPLHSITPSNWLPPLSLPACSQSMHSSFRQGSNIFGPNTDYEYYSELALADTHQVTIFPGLINQISAAGPTHFLTDYAPLCT